MSLQLAANHLAAQGRGPDSTLVHMSPGEVKSLQQLAMAHGGSLSVNPSTGLPEAGFLSNILPMVAGAALMATGVGAPMAAMMVGGGMTVATGSLQKGLIAGLGAYGGAGLAGGLMGAGSAAAASATAPGAEVLDAALAGSGGAGAGAGAGAAGAIDLGAGATNIAPSYGIAPPSLGPGQMMGDAAFKANMTPLTGGTGVAGGFPAQGFEGFQPTPSTQAGLMPATPMPAQAPPTAMQPTIGEGFSKMGRGVEALTTSQGQDAFMKSIGGGKGLMQAGLAAAAPMMTPTTPKPYVPDSRRIDYRFDPGRIEDPEAGYTGAPTGQRRYFNPTYTRLAGGGTVEQMSNANALGANTGYPMADIQRTAYATPYQQPMSRNVVTGPQDSAVDTFTGEERFARGGITKMADGGYSYDPDTQTYSGSPPSGGFNSGISGLPGRAVAGSNAGRVPYTYDPNTKTYKKISPEKPEEDTSQVLNVLNVLDAGGFGGDISVGGETLGDFGHGYGAGAGVGAIGFGQGLSGMGMTGVGGAIADAGIATLGAMEAQAATDAAAQGYGGYGGGGHGGAGGDVGGGSGVGGAEGGYGGGEGGGGYARGGLSHLGDYSDGGRLLRGPGDGVSDSIPAVIGNKRPARLADGEFVVPARIVSELGNGSTEAGARKLYAMMDRIQKARSKTTGKNRVAKNTRSEKYLPA